MKTIYGKVTILIVLTLLLSMPMINLPATVKADPGTINVPGPYGPTISAAITAAFPGDTIIVAAGTYLETLQINKSLTITGVGAVIVKGGAMFATHYGNRQATIYVHDASNVVLNGLDVEGQGLGPGKSYAILYEAASGIVQSCIVSPNTIGDLNAVGIAAWDGSNLAVKDCIVKNFGRIGVYSNAATMDIERNTIIGQPYTGSGDVNYGIEIEDYTGPSTADIIDNEIYNCGNSNPSPLWSSCAILVDIWRYYEAGHLPSTVHIVGNNIHDNFEAIEIVGNVGGIVGNQYAHYNNIHNNLYGVWTDPNNLDNETMFDAEHNWWGEAPPTYEDSHLVDYTNWLTGPYAERLYIDPSAVNKAPGDVNSFFDVYVKLENFANLAGFDIKLTWNNDLITDFSVDYTTYLNALWGAGKWDVVYEQHGVGYYEIAAAGLGTSASNIGASVLFKKTFKVVKSCNFVLTTDILFDVHKLSDNGTPTPNPIEPATITGATYTISGTTPDLEMVVVGQTHAPPFEYCDYFTLEVYATHICVNSPLTDYTITIEYGAHLAKFLGVDRWSGFGTGTAVESPTGTITVHCVGGPQSGNPFLLFALKFHVEFSNTEEHVWKLNTYDHETFNIEMTDATLSFATGGYIYKAGINMPAPLTIRVNFIRGDVDCNGMVNIEDISDAAAYYDKTSADPLWISTIRRYDLNNDNVIDIYDIVSIATNYGYGVMGH